MRRGGFRSWIGQAIVVAMLVALSAASASIAAPVSAGSQGVHGAGLVIRHGNGKIVYVYVQFKEKQISGAELLSRSGLPVKISAVPGLGEEVCQIQQEGCPPSNCYCKSYASPAYYWHYYRLDASGSWAYQQQGPTTAVVRDGDVDGWSWTAGQPDLPKTSINRIASLNGVRRPATPETSTTTPTAQSALAMSSPTASETRASVTGTPGTPAPLAIEGSGGNTFTPVKTKADKTSGGPSTTFLAEIAVALAILALAAGWLAFRRRRGAS